MKNKFLRAFLHVWALILMVILAVIMELLFIIGSFVIHWGLGLVVSVLMATADFALFITYIDFSFK